MNKTLKIIIGIIILLIILWGIIFAVDYNMCKSFKMPIFVIAGETADNGSSGTYYGLGYKVEVKKNISAEHGIKLESVEMYMFNKFIVGAISESNSKVEEKFESDCAIIENGDINNENIIENFINKVTNNEEIVLKIKEYKENNEYVEKELKYIPGTNINQDNIDKNATIIDEIPDTNEEAFGYFSLTTNNDYDNTQIFNKRYWKPARSIENGVIEFGFEPEELICVTGFPVICSYSLESSNYNKEFEINYHQRKDMGIKTIVDKNINSEYNYNIYTFGGDVTITIDTDMLYDLEDALKQKVVTVEEIIEQAKLDEKYSICEGRYYSDGGSMEYGYRTYTILKYNTLNENKDLVFGFSGQIINLVNKELY